MTDRKDIAQWRLRTFTALMSTVRIVALFAAIPSGAFGVYYGLPGLAYLSAIALTWTLIISRLSDIQYCSQVISFLGMVFFVAIGAMVLIGPVGICYLLAVPVMAVILLGLRAAFIALGFGAVCMASLGVAGYGFLPLPFSDSNDISNSAVALFTLNFVCVGTFISISCNTLIKGLSDSLEKSRNAEVSLAQRQDVLHALNKELRLTSAALGGLNEMVLIAKVDEAPGAVQPIIFANAAFERCSGYRADEIIGRSMRMLHGPDTDMEVVVNMAEAMTRRERVSGELVHYTKSGEKCWIEMNLVPFASESRDITHWVAIGRDVTERRRSADAIYQLAFFDVLTGLPNRRLLMERLEIMVASVHAGAGIGALLYIDLDNFKQINDARGHATGDSLLRHIASCLTGAVHRRDTVARLGGDEFVVLIEDLGSDASSATRAALEVAERLREALVKPVDIDGQLYQSSGSIGVALPTRLRHTVVDLLREADTAMYHAKGTGRNGVALFEAAMLTNAENRLTLERDLAFAIQNVEMRLHLQLQVDHNGVPIGAKVLLHWHRADGTVISPEIFMPVAEATGQIVPLGAWVLRQACVAWRELDQAGFTLPLSISISPRQFHESDFVSQVHTIIGATGVPPQQLIFEVTEGLADNLNRTVSRMEELTHFGIRFSINDFSTGYSNLAHLRKMPLYELKIHKSFMRNLPRDVNSTALVQTIFSIADHFNLRVVAEGVETVEQAQFLVEQGRPFMQGYLFYPPMSLRDLISRLANALSR